MNPIHVQAPQAQPRKPPPPPDLMEGQPQVRGPHHQAVHPVALHSSSGANELGLQR